MALCISCWSTARGSGSCARGPEAPFERPRHGSCSSAAGADQYGIGGTCVAASFAGACHKGQAAFATAKALWDHPNRFQARGPKAAEGEADHQRSQDRHLLAVRMRMENL